MHQGSAEHYDFVLGLPWICGMGRRGIIGLIYSALSDLKPSCIIDRTLRLVWKRFKLRALLLEAAQILQGALCYCILGLNYYLKTTKLLFSRGLSAGWMRAPVIDFANGNWRWSSGAQDELRVCVQVQWERGEDEH